MIAKVLEIQVGGSKICRTLLSACLEYPNCPRTKMHFTIELPNGEHKAITIRDDADGVVAYGNFDGLPSFLDYANYALHGMARFTEK